MKSICIAPSIMFFNVLVNAQKLKEMAIRKYDIDLCQSYFIGDAPIDLDFAIQSDCHPMLLLTGRGTSTEDIEKYPMEVTVFQQICETSKLI